MSLFIPFDILLSQPGNHTFSRAVIADPSPPSGPILRFTRNRTLFRLALSAAIAVGITGTCEASLSSKPNNITLSNNLRKASVIIFLVLTILLVFQTILLVRKELSCKYDPALLLTYLTVFTLQLPPVKNMTAIVVTITQPWELNTGSTSSALSPSFSSSEKRS